VDHLQIRGEGIMVNKKLLLLVGALILISVSPGLLDAQEIQVPFTCETPAAMAAPGQSPEIGVIEMLMRGKDLEIQSDYSLEPEDLTGKKTLIFIIGASGKGMGAAGVELEDELEMVDRLVAVCREEGIKIVGLHTGGASRRGPNSDAMINKVVPACDYVVVKKGGNEDGIFTDLCSKNSIPLTEIEKTKQVVDVLEALFQL
jgi:hypothetical protein